MTPTRAILTDMQGDRMTLKECFEAADRHAELNCPPKTERMKRIEAVLRGEAPVRIPLVPVLGGMIGSTAAWEFPYMSCADYLEAMHDHE